MPDFGLFSKAFLVSAVAAGLTLPLLTGFGQAARPRPWRRCAGWIVGLAAGIYAGCGVLDQWPRWPAPEDRDRFLTILLPLTLAVEAAGAWLPANLPGLPAGWSRLPFGPIRRLLRWVVAMAAAPILLYQSTYLADLAGPNSAEWSSGQALVILMALGTALAGEWELLALFQARTSPRAAWPVLAMVALAAGLTVMLSGYLGGGLLGLPLAGAIAGATLASYAGPPAEVSSPSKGGECLGVGLVGIFTVLVVGRFFGALPTGTMIGLFVAPLTVWISELPGLRKMSPGARAAIRMALVAVPLVLIVLWARMKFNADFAHRPFGSDASSNAP